MRGRESLDPSAIYERVAAEEGVEINGDSLDPAGIVEGEVVEGGCWSLCRWTSNGCGSPCCLSQPCGRRRSEGEVMV